MVDYYNVTTNTGDAEIAAAIASNTKLAITHIAFGDGNGAVPTPLKTRTTLVREVHRQAVTKYERHPTNANWIVIETIIPSNIGGFWVREMGVIANGKMISHGSHAPFEKVADPTGVSEYQLKFTQNIKDGNVVNITLDQSLIYASQAWTDENYVPRDEIIDDLTTDDAFKPVSAKQAKNLQDNKLDKDANAVSATKLETSRTVSFSGAATGSVNYDGSGNSSCILTLANSGVVANTYGSNLKIPVITVNQKGLITGVSEQQIPIVDDLTTGGSVKFLSAEQGMVLNDKKLDRSNGTATNLTLSNSVTREITGSNYKITYNDSNRLAIIRMKVFENKTVGTSGVFTIDEAAGYYKALITLPITLQKRISADFALSAASGSVSWINEAGEWVIQYDPIGTNGVTESKVGVHLTCWRGSAREAIDAYLEVVGVF